MYFSIIMKNIIKRFPNLWAKGYYCVICGNRGEKGFYELWRNEPNNFKKAMILEENYMLKRKKSTGLLNHPKKLLRILKNKWITQNKLYAYIPMTHCLLEYKPIAITKENITSSLNRLKCN